MWIAITCSWSGFRKTIPLSKMDSVEWMYMAPWIGPKLPKVLALFDVRMAFDTVNHDILILLVSVDISVKLLECLCSVLDESVPALSLGPLVLIGSPLLLVCCKAPFLAHCCIFCTLLTAVLAAYGVLSQLYADDIICTYLIWLISSI